MGSLSSNLQDHCSTAAERSSNGDASLTLTTRTSLLRLLKSSSFHITTSTNTNSQSPINSSKARSYSFSKIRSCSFSNIRSNRNIQRLCKIQTLSAKLPSAFSNAFNHRKQETQDTTSPVSDMVKTSTDQRIGVFDASPICTNISHVRPTNENVVDDESDAFSISFRSAKADQSQKNSDFSDTITWDQLVPLSNVSPRSFNGCDQQQLSSNVDIQGYNGKRKMDGIGAKKLKHSKRWKQTCMHFKLSSCPFNLLRKKQLMNFNKARNSTSDSIDGKSNSFGSAFFSCSSKSSYGDDLELTPPRNSALNPTAQMELGAEGGENEFWMKRILMGKRCRPLEFSGVLHHDGKGMLLKELLEKG